MTTIKQVDDLKALFLKMTSFFIVFSKIKGGRYESFLCVMKVIKPEFCCLI